MGAVPVSGSHGAQREVVLGYAGCSRPDAVFCLSTTLRRKTTEEPRAFRDIGRYASPRELSHVSMGSFAEEDSPAPRVDTHVVRHAGENLRTGNGV